MDELNETWLAAAFDRSGALVCVSDTRSHRILYANRECREVLGSVSECPLDPFETMEMPPTSCAVPAEGAEESTFLRLDTVMLNDREYAVDTRMVEWEGSTVTVRVAIDVTEKVRADVQRASERANDLLAFEALIDATIEGLIIYDDEKRCSHVNNVAPQLLGYTKEEMLGKDALHFIAPESREAVRRRITIENQRPYEAYMIRKDGSRFPAMLRGRDVVLGGKKIRVSAVMDISEIKEKENQIRQMAQYDTLTHLPNRRFFQERLEYALKFNRQMLRYSALLFIDLDHFKTVNDSRGHLVGDLVLIEAAQRIERTVREIDTVARLGGDEFVVLIETFERDEKRASEIASSIAETILTELKHPYEINGYGFHLSASIGIALFGGDAGSIDEMMKYADSAMYHAKESGRDTFRFYDPELQRKMEAKIVMLERLRTAVENESMILFYQPQIEGTSENVVGVEALLRWRESDGTMIPPGRFIPLAEESGLIVPLGEWILHEAARQLKRWENDPVRSTWRISVNVSYKQFEKENFVSLLESVIRRHAIRPERMRLELTEGLVIKNTEAALEKIHRLKQMGVSLSIDDFGTGYSSLSYLKKLPIDELKIDQSFVRDVVVDASDRVLIETILSIGRQFGFEVIAEGVENEAQHESLRAMGCRYFQGYLFGKPAEVAAL